MSLVAEPDAMRRLMHTECVVVYAAVGDIYGADGFLWQRLRRNHANLE